MSDYGSGDELFDGVDPDQLCSQNPTVSTVKTDSQKRKCNDANFGHDLFDDDADAIVPSILTTYAGCGTRSAKRVRPEDEVGDSFKDKIAQRLLWEKFGYESFRHEQADAIQRVLKGENTLTIFPTGAGKSLCYQIPAIAFEHVDREDGTRGDGEHGVSLVVSPLIALMKDQVDALKRKGISAECLDSTKTWEQTVQISDSIRAGRLRLLYCAPERLNNEGFVEMIRHVRGGIRLVAVDEAHCISEWGHSFRPDYLKVARFVDEVQAECVICLTATATPKVAEDIQKAFKIQDQCVFRTSSYRPNLSLGMQAVGARDDKMPLIAKFLKANPGPSLVYVTLQQQSEVTARELSQKFGLQAVAFFHAGMKPEQRTAVQEAFMTDRVRIVVATIAFGMGIDKPDVRAIVHCELPSTIEEYSQQVGRAGRDGKPSFCLLLSCEEDWHPRETFARGDTPSKPSLRSLLKDIFSEEVVSLSVGESFKRAHHVQSREFDIRMSPLSIIYATLELRFGLIRAVTPEYSQYRFVASSRYFPLLKSDRSREGQAILKYAIKKAALHHIPDMNHMLAATGLRRADVVHKLNQLHDTGVIELKASGVEARYRLLNKLSATDKEIDTLVDKLYKDLLSKEEIAMRRTQDVLDLMTGDECFALALARHFGMGLPGGKEKCGHCTHCETGSRIKMPPRPKGRVDMDKINKVLAACDVRDDPRLLTRVAFGIKSPRVTRLGLDKSPVFQSLIDHDFESLLREFTKACEAAGYRE